LSQTHGDTLKDWLCLAISCISTRFSEVLHMPLFSVGCRMGLNPLFSDHSLTHTQTHTHTHTHTHTYTYTHPHPHKHTHTLFHPLLPSSRESMCGLWSH